MQIIYIVVFMTGIIMSVALGLQRGDDDFQTDASVTASHFLVWNKGAVDFCHQNTCTSGVVNPRNNLSPSIQASPLFVAGRFTSRYDATTSMLFTYVEPAVETKGIPFSMISATLSQMAGDEDFSFGTFSKTKGAVVYSAKSSLHATQQLAVPSPLQANMADGTVVLVQPI